MPSILTHRYDAIIVLANLMTAQGELNPETRARVDAAVDALNAGGAPVLVACGWAYRPDSKIRVADAMKRYAIEQRGVPPGKILCEENSRDTVGDAVYTRRNFGTPLGWRSIVVVTSQYHAERSRAIFAFVYGPEVEINVIGAPSDDTDQLRASEASSLAAFLTTFDRIQAGDDVAIFERLTKQHPFYNGTAHPAVQVDLSDPYEVRGWVKSLGCTEQELRDVVKAVGPSVEAVKAYLA